VRVLNISIHLSDFGFICKIPQKHSISVLSGLDKLEAESIMYERINQFIKYQPASCFWFQFSGLHSNYYFSFLSILGEGEARLNSKKLLSRPGKNTLKSDYIVLLGCYNRLIACQQLAKDWCDESEATEVKGKKARLKYF
jgi:hypothetical protein